MNLSTKQENEAKIIKDLRVDSDDEDTVIVRHSYDIYTFTANAGRKEK